MPPITFAHGGALMAAAFLNPDSHAFVALAMEDGHDPKTMPRHRGMRQRGG